jgi:hypothetical protein
MEGDGSGEDAIDVGDNGCEDEKGETGAIEM